MAERMTDAQREKYIELATWLIGVVGPSDVRDLPARVAAQFDWLETADMTRMRAQAVKTSLLDLLKVLEARAATQRDDWLMLAAIIKIEMDRGHLLPHALSIKLADLAHCMFIAKDLPQPKRRKGRPPGTWGVRDPGAMHAIALNVHLVKRQMERDGHSIPTYVKQGNRDNTVAAIVARALQNEGMRGMSVDSVTQAYQKYEKQITAQNR